MRILQVYKDYFPPVRGGIEGHINLLSNGLRERGIDVEVLVSNTNGKLKIETIDGITVTKVPQITRLASAPLNYSLFYWIKKIGEKFDLLHFHLPNPTAVMSFLISGLKKSTIATYHSDIIRQRYTAMLYRPFLEIFLTKTDRIIATSPNYIDSSRILPKYRQKCQIVPLGVNIARFKGQYSSPLDISSIRQSHGDRILLFIGKFRYYKGLHILIEAMKQINGKLLLIGEGFLEYELRKQVAVDGLEKKVAFLGELSDQDVNTFLQACDVFVLPSVERSEAFGIVQLEAMACGKPVVCTELGTGTTYVTKHQKNGIVVEPNQPAALAQAINFLLDNPEIRLRYGQAGFERVEKYFSVNRMIDDIKDLYAQCVDSQKTNIES
ncbi:MAG: glycosyltransferase [Desulfobacterales bacterium]|jgi:rhamnosyl/mannosyltransferase